MARLLVATLYREDRTILRGVGGVWFQRTLFIYPPPTPQKILNNLVTMLALDNSLHLLERENKHLLFKSLLFEALAAFLLLSNIVCKYKTYHLSQECFIGG